MKLGSARIANGALIAIAAVLTACAAPDTEEPAVGESPVAEAEPQAAPAEHGKHGKHGMDRMLRSVLAEVGLNEDQEAKVDALIEKMKQNHKAGFSAKKELRAALATAAADGQIDDAEIAAARSAVEEAEVARAKAMSAAIVELHGILDAEQRQELVDIVREKMADKRARWAGKAKGKHGHPGMHGHPGKMGRKGGMFAHGLELSDEQKQKLTELREQNRPDKEDMKAKMEAFRTHLDGIATVFVADQLDPAALGLEAMARKRAAAGIDHKVAKLRGLLSVLDESQRAKLVEKLEKGKERRGR